MESLQIIEEAVGRFSPSAETPTPDEALALLLRSGRGYDSIQGSVLATGALAPFGSGVLSLPAVVHSCPLLTDVLSNEDALLFEGFRERLLLTEDEHTALIQEQGLAGLYVDPVLKRDRKCYLGLLITMHEKGLLRWLPTMQEQVGLFFVAKKNGSLRLIADARRTDSRFRKPYTIQLPTAEGATRFVAPQDGSPFSELVSICRTTSTRCASARSSASTSP